MDNFYTKFKITLLGDWVGKKVTLALYRGVGIISILVFILLSNSKCFALSTFALVRDCACYNEYNIRIMNSYRDLW